MEVAVVMTNTCPCGIHRDDCDYHKPEPVVSQCPVHDVSGTVFIVGVTNFTLVSLADSIFHWGLAYGFKYRWEDFILTVHPALFHRIKACSLLDNGTACTLQGMPVETGEMSKTGGVFESEVIHKNCRRKVVLVTREH